MSSQKYKYKLSVAMSLCTADSHQYYSSDLVFAEIVKYEALPAQVGIYECTRQLMAIEKVTAK